MAALHLVAGEALIDFTTVEIDGATAWLPHPGGGPCNVAVGLGRLGVPTAFLGRLSTDLFGDVLVEHLRANAVSDRFLTRADAPSTLAFVSTDAAGQPTYAFFADGAADRGLAPADVPAQLDEVGAVHVGTLGLAVEPMATTLEEFTLGLPPAVRLSVDPNVRPGLVADADAYRSRLRRLMGRADIVKASDEDLGWLYPGQRLDEVVEDLLTEGSGLVVVTAGARGATARTQRGNARVPVRDVDVVDTVGAGDAFAAALLAWLAEDDAPAPADCADEDLAALLRHATTAAALTCTRAGAEPPTRAELATALG